MHREVKCEEFVSFIWMGSGVVTGARSDRGAVSHAQRPCRVPGFQVRILGTSQRSVTLASVRSPRSSPDCWWQGWVTAPGRHKVKVLEGLLNIKGAQASKRLLRSPLFSNLDRNLVIISCYWWRTRIQVASVRLKDSVYGSWRTQLRKSEIRPKAWPWEAGEDSVSCSALLSLSLSGLSPITDVH